MSGLSSMLRGTSLPIVLRLQTLAVILVVDLLLLPMFHLGGLPIKLTFVVLALWAVSTMSATLIVGHVDPGRNGRFILIAFPILGIAVAGIFGQLYLSMQGDLVDPEEGLRSVLIYVLMILAFGFGQSVPGFSPKWLLRVLYAAVTANFLFVFAGSDLPWLTNFYYDETVADEILGFARPRGLFGNPNATMLLVNMPLLFAVAATRLGYLKGVAKWHYVLIVVLALSLAFVLGSRSEFVSTTILGMALMFSPSFRRVTKIRGSVIVILGSLIALSALIQLRDSSYSFVDQTLSRFEDTNLFDVEHATTANILRPLITWDMFRDRFVVSPLFGTGFSMIEQPPFEKSPVYFHNDWFRILATSGILGGLFALFLAIQIAKRLGWVLLLPYFLPGLTNTFILNIPAVMFYFFMVGVLMERGARQASTAEVLAAPRP